MGVAIVVLAVPATEKPTTPTTTIMSIDIEGNGTIIIVEPENLIIMPMLIAKIYNFAREISGYLNALFRLPDADPILL